MRRRIRSAAFPVHRHALPQVRAGRGAGRARLLPRLPAAVRRRRPDALQGPVRAHDRVRGARHDRRASRCSGCTGTGCATRRSASTCRSPQAVLRRGARARRLRRGRAAEADLHDRRASSSVTVPTGVLVLFGLLMRVFLGGSRFLVHLRLRAPAARPTGRRRDARSVLIVGAGDGGRLLLREILRNPELGYRPVGFVDDDPRKQGARIDRGIEVLGTTAELAARARGRRARRGADRDPVRARHDARPRRQRLPRARRAGAHDADRLRAAAERRPAHAPGARGARRGRPRPRARADGDRAGRRLPDRPLRDGHRRRRLDRRRAVPPDRARRARRRSCCSTTPRTTCSRSSASSSTTATSLNAVAVLADCKEEERMREVFAEHRPDGRLPRRRLQARRADGGQPGRGGAQQRARHARDGARRRRGAAPQAFVLVSTDKAVEPATVMGASKALAEWAVEAADARYPDTAYAVGALRQRARLLRLGRADLPPPDRQRRPGHGHRPGA